MTKAKVREPLNPNPDPTNLIVNNIRSNARYIEKEFFLETGRKPRPQETQTPNDLFVRRLQTIEFMVKRGKGFNYTLKTNNKLKNNPNQYLALLFVLNKLVDNPDLLYSVSQTNHQSHPILQLCNPESFLKTNDPNLLKWISKNDF